MGKYRIYDQQGKIGLVGRIHKTIILWGCGVEGYNIKC
jgi:hypothetical protein